MAVFDGVVPAIIGAAGSGAAADYEIERSLRFYKGDSAYLNRTPSSAGNRKTFTLSFWIKRTIPVANFNPTTASVFGVSGGSSWFDVGFYTSDELQVITNSGVGDTGVRTQAVFRDFSSWYHFVIAVDTTNSTAADRIIIYVNGTRQDVTVPSGMPSQNSDTLVNATNAHYFGRDGRSSNVRYGDNYFAEINFVDGQALAPTDFGGTDDNNNWNPKAYSGSYGTNGFHLDFSDPSNLGNDAAGSNNWTPNNFFYLDAKTEVTSAFVGTGTTHGALANLLNNDTTNGYGVQAGTLTYTPSSTTTVSSQIKFWYSTGQSNTEFRVNGGSWNTLPLPSGVGTYTYTAFTGTVTSMEWRAATSSELVSVHKIQIDDQTLVNATIAAGNDSLIDTPTNYEADSGNNGGNYATLNPLATNNVIYENGNLHTRKGPGTNWDVAVSNFGMTTGKWYCEISNEGGTTHQIGIVKLDEAVLMGSNVPIVDYTWGWGFINDGTQLRLRSDLFGGGNATDTLFGATGSNYVAGDVIGLAYDADNQEFSIYKNGTLVGNTTSSWTNAPTPGTYAFAISLNSGDAAVDFNFGQRPFMISSLPTDHLSLCTQNLSNPTIADGSTAMDATLYTGNGSSQSITGLNFQPDLVWIKNRSSITNQTHALFDVIRGKQMLASSSTNSESQWQGGNGLPYRGYVDSFDSNGFSLVPNSLSGLADYVNYNNTTYVAWSWDAGTSTVSNSDGTITTQVRANQSVGVSVVTYSGTGSNATFGHGLNAVPELVIVKSRSNTQNWAVQHAIEGPTKYAYLNSTNEFRSTSGTAFWNDTAPTTSVVSVGTDNDTNANGYTYVSYCFAPVEGYSAFGSYDGNSSNDGPFVFTGFRVRWILIKCTNAAGQEWVLLDAVRDPYNVVDNALYANASDQEATGSTRKADFLSNGFKLRDGTSGATNLSGRTYAYAAFAEHPFKTARAR